MAIPSFCSDLHYRARADRSLRIRATYTAGQVRGAPVPPTHLDRYAEDTHHTRCAGDPHIGTGTLCTRVAIPRFCSDLHYRARPDRSLRIRATHTAGQVRCEDTLLHLGYPRIGTGTLCPRCAHSVAPAHIGTGTLCTPPLCTRCAPRTSGQASCCVASAVSAVSPPRPRPCCLPEGKLEVSRKSKRSADLRNTTRQIVILEG